MVIVVMVLLAFATLIAPGGSSAAENDFKVVDGVLVRPVVLPGDGVAEIAGDDRAIYYIDLRGLPQQQARIEAQTYVTVVGYEGPRPDQISASIVKVRNAPDLVPSEPRRPADLRVVDGRVQAVSRRALTLLTNDGRTVTVRVGDFRGKPWYVALVGERLRVLGVLGDDDTLTANALIQQTMPAARASSVYTEGEIGP